MIVADLAKSERAAGANGRPETECRHAHQSVITYVFAIRRWLREDPAMRPEVEEALAGIERAIAQAQALLSRDEAL